MDITKYIESLPEKVLLNGEFCVTLKGDKQPFDPFKGYTVSAKDPFYELDKLAELNLDRYDTLGLKVGKGLSVIDLDKCVNPTTGEISDFAIEIVQFMQSYTELSPSGKGIRILFDAINSFDFTQYKTKNSIVDMEYYDADDQEVRGGRMCRLSGNRIFGYEYRAVDTSEILDKYMKRPPRTSAADLEDGEIDMAYVDLVYVLIATRPDLKNLMNREIDVLSESDADLILCNAIAEYTRNLGEIMEVFKKTRYYRTKGVRSDKKKHKDKWDSEYGWNTVRMSRPSEIKLSYQPRSVMQWPVEYKIRVAVAYALISKGSVRLFDKVLDWGPIEDEQIVIDCLYELTSMRLRRLDLKKELIAEYEKVRD